METFKYFAFALLFFCCLSLDAQQKNIELLSPNGKIKVSVDLKDRINYSVSNDGNLLFNQDLQLQLRNETLGKKPKLSAQSRTTVNEDVKPAVPFKFSTVKNHYNALTLRFSGNWSVEFRAFDDGVAYRIVTAKKGEIEVMHEDVNLSFPDDYLLHLQYAGKTRGFAAVYEELYSHISSKEWNAADSMMAVLPLLIDTRKGDKILFSETDINDYPNLFFKGKGKDNGISSALPPSPLKMEVDTVGNIWITERADYIAKTVGNRTFPWRWFIIGNDRLLLESPMAARLAPPCALQDVSWIKPGQAFWDYINRSTDYGPLVTYRQGINTPTFKRYIDFAGKNNIPYLLIDAAWAKDHSAAPELEVVPDLDLPEIIRYGKSKNVAIVLWMFYHPIQRDLLDDSYNLFEYYSKMGVAGFKVDFMDRSDQWIVNFYEQAAREAAKYRMILEFHGSYKPTGLEYKYPNILSYEGVRGLEYGGGTTPENSIYLPFIRNVVGPMSFTPGSMLNTQPEHLRTGWGYNWATIGTRVHQMAYFIMFESGLQMIADSPRRFEENPDCSDFIFSVPVVWDETRALAAEVGQYAIVAKRRDNRWWIGGITNNAERRREIDLTLDFLPEGKTFDMLVFEDGPNANGQAMDYNIRSIKVKKDDRINVRLARNGGFAARIE
ncbi:MAG: glycoside hydrolase family 97 protein [Prevotellaceae bacterium]|jgi:alpha-glucosidase|nr:glycoside hydrolase family 97 protein [Prevotellaceae bacterium]